MSRQNILAKLVSQALLGRYVSAAILVDRRSRYLYSIGPTRRYLQTAPGPASLDLFAIIPTSLHDEIRSAILRVARDRKPSVVNGGRTESKGADLPFDVHVDLLYDQGEDLFLICFVDETTTGLKEGRPAENHPDVTRLSELEQELEKTRAELQRATRDLEIAKEEQKTVAANALLLNEELASLNARLSEAPEHRRAISDDLKNVLRSTEVPMLFLDRALDIRFFTPAIRLLFDITSSDIGRPISDFDMPGEDPDLGSDAVVSIETGDSIDKQVAAPDGRRYIRRIKPFRTAQGKTDGVVVTFMDIGAQGRVAEDGKTAKKSDRHAAEAKSHFLAVASHDLRQPLQTLRLLLGLLENGVKDNQSRIFLRQMDETLASMSRILTTALDISQIEAGMVQVKLENFVIADILERLREEFSYQARAKGIELRVVRCEATVYTDPRLLERILRNLLSNALKYTLTGKVLVGCRRRGAKLRVEVWDTGIGIPENQIAKVFKKYRRLDMPIESGGHGLGLFIVKWLGDLLDLAVSVRSQSKKGSVFSIDIERAAGGEALTTVPAPRQLTHSRADVHAPSVLVIEDDDGMRDLLRIGLEQVGHSVVAAANAAQAFEVIREVAFVPDIVLVDHNLQSGSNGLSAIEEIRRGFGRQIPALLLTEDISRNALRTYARKNISHLEKPATLRDVIGAFGTFGDVSAGRPDDEVSRGVPAVTVDADLEQIIDIVDDDEHVRDHVRTLFGGAGWSVASYASAEDYLSQYDPERRSCLLIDAYLPGMSGLVLLRVLKERAHPYPVIVITGYSDVSMAVEAMRHGAVDFIEKPFSAEEILASVEKASELAQNRNEQVERRGAARAKLARLTRRQREILERIVAGEPNKIIAAEMNLSQRTVENHRASIMRRTGSGSLSMLLRLVAAAEQ